MFLCNVPRSHAKLLTAARGLRGSLLRPPAPRARSRAARAAGGDGIDDLSRPRSPSSDG
jgi:hypothetical protein